MASRLYAIALLLVLALITGLMPNAARADGDNAKADQPIRLYASARFGPIGAINSDSPGISRVIVNGRMARGEQMIWGGELIEVPLDRSVRVSFDSIGQVTLNRGAMVRFGTALANPDDAGRRVLVALLINGGLRVNLAQDAGAYIEAAGSRFTASRNAQFQMSVNEGAVSFNATAGTISVEQQPVGQRRYILRPVAGQGATLSVAARSTRQVQIQVTDENDRPVPDLAMLFSLGSPCLGSLGIGAGAGMLTREKTDNRGIASVPWVAGAAKCAGAITVNVEGTDASYVFQAQIRQLGFWTARNSLLVGAAAAAAGAGVGIAVSQTGGNKEPIVAVPPPQVRP
jgi:hypothetical protein